MTKTFIEKVTPETQQYYDEGTKLGSLIQMAIPGRGFVLIWQAEYHRHDGIISKNLSGKDLVRMLRKMADATEQEPDAAIQVECIDGTDRQER
jgi:hypothetical protein